MARVSIACISAALWLVPLPCAAQADATDEFIEAEMERQNIPGLSLAVLRNGEIVKARGYGLANIQDQVPARTTTVYKIASVSKLFIAAGIMRLIQEGRIGLDASIEEFLPNTPASWSGITIRHLLSHTSGLVREAPGFDALREQADSTVIETAYDLPLKFSPGEKTEYSNLGYFVLAEVIRRVTGLPWVEYLSRTIFRPLGMDATHPTNTMLDVPERARGYVDNDELRDAPEWQALRPSGAFLSSVLDLAKWDGALYTDGILNAATRQLMWTRSTLSDSSSSSYGLGWMVTEFLNRTVVYHTGGMPGARSAFAHIPDEGLTIIILMNMDDVDIGTLMFGVTRLHLSAVPSERRPVPFTFSARRGPPDIRLLGHSTRDARYCRVLQEGCQRRPFGGGAAERVR